MKKTLLKRLVPPLLSLCVVAGIWGLRGHERFDETKFSLERVKSHVVELSSPNLAGRSLGTPGQKATETYLENFFKQEGLDYEVLEQNLLVPNWSDEGFIQIGSTAVQKIYQDFEPTADYYGGPIQFEGDILFAGNDFFKVDPSLMKDRIVFFYANRLTEENLLYAKANGAKGLLYYTTFSGLEDPRDHLVMDHKTLEMSHKLGSDLFMAEVGQGFIQDMVAVAKNHLIPGHDNKITNYSFGGYNIDLVGMVPNVRIDASLNYQMVPAKNYIVSIKGKSQDKATSWITHYDGLGSSVSETGYYPGTVDGAASTALLLEMAKTAKNQAQAPVHDIQMVFLSGLYVNDQSAKLAASELHKRYPYSAHWLVEGIGYQGSSMRLMNWDPYNDLDRMLVSQIRSNMDQFPFRSLSAQNGIYQAFDRYNAFKGPDRAVITVTDQVAPGAIDLIGSPFDNLEIYSEENMAQVSTLILGHLDRQLYQEKDFLFIMDSHLLLMLLLLAGLHLLALPEKLGAAGHGPRWAVSLSEQVPYKLLRKAVLNAIPFIISIFIVNLILSIPADMNMKTISGVRVTNFSLYDTFKNSYIGFQGFLGAIFDPEPALFKEISLYLKRSLVLVTWGLTLAVCLGLLKGLADAYGHKGRTNASTFAGIMLYSIPDVLIAFVSLVSIVYLSKVQWVTSLADANTLRIYVMPIFSLSIVPIIYVSRLVFVTLEEEKKKDYVKFLTYKGLSKGQIYRSHFSRVALTKILDSAKSVIMLIFSNLIVVEYLFNYPGIMFNLIESVGEPIKVIILALSIGLSFVGIYLLSQLLLQVTSPGRRIR